MSPEALGNARAAATPRKAGAGPLRGIGLKLLHVLAVTLMLAIVKAIEGLPVTEVMFFRSLLSFVPIALFLALRGELMGAIRTGRPLGHLVRTILSMTTTGLTFVAVRALPLPEAVTLQYTQPLFVVTLSALILGEQVRRFRWGAVAVGFVGALIVTWPKLTLLTSGVSLLSSEELIGAAAALGAALAYALNVLMVSQLVRTESSSTIALWLGLYSSGVLLLTLPFGWVHPGPVQLGQLAAVGLIGALVLVLMTESLRYASASTTAPFEYASLIFATVLGFALFGDVPDLNTLGGGAILIAAGLAIFLRERRLALRTGRDRSGGLPPA